ncbi:alpha/beta fold hydrolase [bacterium]|nr:alpha/beta fold hydrolase [bacterium]
MAVAIKHEIDLAHPEETTPAVDAILGANPFVALSPRDTLRTLGQFLVNLAAHPEKFSSRFSELTFELMRIAAGASEIEPEANDRRFSDPAFAENPVYRRLMQTYLAWRAAMHDLVGLAAESDGKDWKTPAQERFAVTLMTEALAPTNLLWGNPAALKRAFDTAGMSLLYGARNFIVDLFTNNGMPSQVDKRPFEIGRTIAATPGAVIHRGNLCEVIQYRPATPQVFERPVLLIPPQINKYYVMDMAPKRSFTEYAVGRGIQFFTVSWRNPGPQDRDLGLDDYVAACEEAAAIAAEVSGSPDINLAAVCAGGITSSLMLGHLAAHGDRRINAATLIVTMLDSSEPSMTGMFANEETVRAAVEASRAKGVLDAATMQRTFAWLRPNDLVWHYWVNNYLMGKDPAPFDILYWNSDSTNLPARLHAGFLEILLRNPLVEPGAAKILDTPIDLSRFTGDMYVLAGMTDHICAWRACHRAARLFGGHTEFVLSASGHVQSLVCPPGNFKMKYFTNPRLGDDPDQWMQGATEHKGTWWDNWLDWIEQRSGAKRPAPAELGGGRYKPIEPAPGSYVRGRP